MSRSVGPASGSSAGGLNLPVVRNADGTWSIAPGAGAVLWTDGVPVGEDGFVRGFVAIGGEAAAVGLDAARVAGTVGDVLGGIDEHSREIGHRAGRVDTLLWMQEQLQLLLRSWGEADRFADLRPLQEALTLVQDTLKLIEAESKGPATDSVAWATPARGDLGEPDPESPEGMAVPEA